MSAELEAGGNSDLIIHERVMGHCAHRSIIGVGQVNLYLKCLDCNALDPDDLKAPAYTTDIAAAMQVLERLSESAEVEWVDVRYWPRYGEVGRWWECRIARAGWSAVYWQDEDETAPLAICRAALIMAAELADQST